MKMLMLPYKRYAFSFDGDFTIAGHPILLRQPADVRSSDDAEDGDTGVCIWDAAVFLSLFLQEHAQAHVRGKTVLELGAGLGVCSVAAAALGASCVIATDLQYALQGAKENLDANAFPAVASVCVLNWHSPEACAVQWDSVDTVIASDVVWLQHLVLPLVKTINYAASRNRNITVIMSNQERSSSVTRLFYQTLAQAEQNLAGCRWRIHTAICDGNLSVLIMRVDSTGE